MVSEIQPVQTFSRLPPTHLETMGENNAPTALKGCGVKSNTSHYTVTTMNIQLKKLNQPLYCDNHEYSTSKRKPSHSTVINMNIQIIKVKTSHRTVIDMNI